MARYKTTISSPWSLTEAFDYMADLTNFEEWDPGVSSARALDSPDPRLGARYEVEANGATLVYEIRRFEPPFNMLVVAKKKLLTSKDEISISPRLINGEVSGSEITYDAQLELNGPLSVLDPLLGLAFRRIGKQAGEGLRQRVTTAASANQRS